jgi:hypothetical protein
MYGSSVAAERSMQCSLAVPSYSHTHTGTILVQVKGDWNFCPHTGTGT